MKSKRFFLFIVPIILAVFVPTACATNSQPNLPTPTDEPTASPVVRVITPTPVVVVTCSDCANAPPPTRTPFAVVGKVFAPASPTAPPTIPVCDPAWIRPNPCAIDSSLWTHDEMDYCLGLDTCAPFTLSQEGIRLSNQLSADEKRMLVDGLEHLQNCAPPLYEHVRTQVKEIRRGQFGEQWGAYVRAGKPIVFLPALGAVNNPARFKDSMRTFAAAAFLVHESRHIEMGKQSTEPDAYRFELGVFTPSCKPNDIENGPWTDYESMRRYAEWRASLPYPGEPPPEVIPPEYR